MKRLACVVWLALALPLFAVDPPKLPDEVKGNPGEFIQIRADTDAPHVQWWSPDFGLNVFPIHLLKNSKTAVVTATQAGRYRILAVVAKDDEPSEFAVCTVVIGNAPKPPPGDPEDPPPPPPPDEKADARKALGRIQFGSAGCTATVIGPRRPDGRWDVLTAAHCVSSIGQRGTYFANSGDRYGITVKTLNRTADVCWCEIDQAGLDLPYALLADENPSPGTQIWHAGFGVHIPGNLEEGTVVDSTNSEGQTSFQLSVSSGDSGGGIFRKDDNKLISNVCCTTRRGGPGKVWGCSVSAFTPLRPSAQRAHDDEWKPSPIPLKPDIGRLGPKGPDLVEDLRDALEREEDPDKAILFESIAELHRQSAMLAKSTKAKTYGELEKLMENAAKLLGTTGKLKGVQRVIHEHLASRLPRDEPLDRAKAETVLRSVAAAMEMVISAGIPH